MASALSWLTLFYIVSTFLTGNFSRAADCNMDCQSCCLIDCKKGHYYIAGNCLECPVGFYCPGGRAAPRKCPVGTANQLTAQADLTACQACPDGYISSETGAGCRLCPDGYLCDPHSGLQRSCNPGQYSPEGKLECWQCPQGYVCPDGRKRQRCSAGQEPNPSRTHCVTCTLGFFSTEEALECQPCPAGHHCPHIGTVQPLLCPPGSCADVPGQSECQRCNESSCCLDTVGQIQQDHEPTESSEGLQCQPCPAGRFCADGFTASPCPAGNFKPREQFCEPSDSSSCLPGPRLCLKCPTGYFCPSGASYPHPCQLGTYNPLQGQDDATDCRACPAGRACTQAGLSQPDSECMAGYVCPVGSSSPHAPSNACPPGTFSNHLHLFDKSQCETCPARFFCTRGTGGKQKPPVPCPVGHYCPPGTKHPTQYKCAPGTWSNRTSLASEKECLLCPAGWFCVAGAHVLSGRCSPGHYCPDGTRTSIQFPCPEGTYSTRLGNGRVEDCTACPMGSYCTNGTSKPTLCPVGTYRTEPGAKMARDCIPCPGGYHCPELGTVAPQACGAGRFSDPGSASCLPCLVGHYCAGEVTSRESMLRAMVCPAGLLCPEGQAITPDASRNACPRGYYCPGGDVDSHARPCPNGTYGEQKGLVREDECLRCPAGKYCYREWREPRGILHPTGDCPPGYTCPPGTGFPFSFPCLPGFYWDGSAVERGNTCKPCPAEHYCDSPAMTQPKTCPAGFYCARGSSHPEPCPEGTYSNRKGLAALLDCSPCGGGFYCAGQGQTGPSGLCEAGFHCQGRAVTPLPTDGVTGNVCPAGAYCPPGSPSPMPCPPGTYSNVSGLRSLKQCLDCPPGLYCDGANSQAPTGPCKPGYFCTGAAKTALQQVTMKGHYSLAGAFRPEPCPLGSFQPVLGQPQCRECSEGTFCNQTGLAEPVTCPKGHYCPAKSILPLPCPVGTYTDLPGATGTGSCKPCMAGMYCSTAGLAMPKGLCQPGYYCAQGSHSSSPMGLPFGDLCLEGYYCPAGTKHPREMPCPAGTWNEQRGAQNASWCLLCPPGFFCNVAGRASPAGLCAPGYYCTGGARTPMPTDAVTGDLCPEGHFCPAGSAAPSPCPDGEYSNGAGQDKCFPCPSGFHCQHGIMHRCPPGFYCPQKTGISFYPCPGGTYNPSYGISQADRCQRCPAGMFCGEFGLSSPSGPCSPGFFCTAGASVPNPDGATNTSTGGPCPPGHFCPAGTSIPLPCPVGTYSDRLYLWLESSCTVCPPGYYCSSAGLAAPSGPCSAGYYCLSGASSSSPADIWQKGGPCPVSHFCPEGTSYPLPCLAGTYNNLTRQATCMPCAAGYYCPENTTSYHAYPCPPGFYCPKATRFATEFPCPRGYYNPDPMTQSLDSCLPCPPGHYCGKENLTVVSGKCDAGWFCVSAAWTAQPFDLDNYTNANCLCPATATGGKCTAGFYCPEGSHEPIPCPPGLYCHASGLSEPSGECATGFYCTGGAASPKPTDGVTGNICPLGTYCIAGSTMPRLCPPGTFSNLLGQSMVSECQFCPSGFYCAGSGLSAPTGECWEGYYCDSSQGPVSDFTLYPCPQGFYCPPGTQQGTQYSCPPSTFGPRQKLKSIQECQSCPPGKYCELPGLSVPTGNCSEGFWCKGGAQIREPIDGVTGLPCPPGHYCLAGTPIPSLCPHGTWSSKEGNKNLRGCQPCPGGHYCNSTGLVAPSGHCSPGFYCIARAQTPTPSDGLSGAPCPMGHSCPLGTKSPIPCFPGTYMPHTHGAKCYTCPKGKFCVPRQEPEFCPKGFFCPEGTGLDWQPCPPGTYSPEQGLESSSGCRACDGGKFCLYRNATDVTGECWEGYYCAQGSDRPNPEARPQGQAGPCPPGHYCPKGTVVPKPCPVGTFSTRIKLSSETQCSPCLPGHYCNSTGLQVPTGQCREGFYCTLGSTIASIPIPDTIGGPCPTGYFCPRGTAIPLACPAGSYNPLQRQASCLLCARGFFCPKNSSSLLGSECPAGHYCPPGTASATQYPCPRGTYNPEISSSHVSHCIPCDPGHYCALAGQSRITGPCSAGYYCSAGISTPTPTDGLVGNMCPMGHYCPQGSALPQSCPLGYYSNSTRNTEIEDCLLCDTGYFCNGTGLVSPSGICEAGFYCTRGAVSPRPSMTTRSGGPCPPGHYCVLGSSRAQPCPAGSYSPFWGMQQCLECPEGFYCRAGSTNYTDCPAGHYCPRNTEFATQYPCPQGTYSKNLNMRDASKCQLCPAGKVCSKPGLTSPDGPCMAGWFCPPGSALSEPVSPDYICPVGHYCPTGSPEPKPCPSGKYQDQTGQSLCKTCPAGKFCALEGQTQGHQEFFSHGVIKPADCPAGYYCISGTKAAKQHPCPEGTFSNQTGLSSSKECRACPGGKFCGNAGLLAPSGPCLPRYYCTLKAHVPNPVNDETGDLCPTGHFCPLGSSSPVPCPTGTFQPQSGMASLNACLPCPGGRFCQGEGLANVSGTCHAGYYCDTGSTQKDPKRCPPGSYCPEGTESPIPCGAGSLNPHDGKWNSTDCHPCPAGYFCSGSGTQTPRLCPKGYFCPPGTSFGTEHPCPRGTSGPRSGATGESDCEPCPAGMYCSSAGLSEPSGLCHAGYYCTRGAIHPAPIKHRVESAGLPLPVNDICPPGHFCLSGTSHPMPCPPGSYSTSLGVGAEEQCQPCPAGRYCSQAGLSDLSQTSPCHAGYVCHEGNSVPCPSDGIHGYKCPSGFHCPTGTRLEIPCEPGTFSPMPGASTCLPCPAGMACRHAATVEPVSCPRGYYCPARTATPLPCPEGTLNTLEGALSPTACKLCPVGRYCRGDANWEPDGLCSAGYYCSAGATDAVPHRTPGLLLNGPCPPGHYCPEGTRFPVACPLGTLNNGTGGSSHDSCVPCYPGFFCASIGLSSPTGPCAAGFYCPANFSSFSPTAFLCPKGHFCSLGSAHPAPCPTGQYQPNRGSESCIPCQPGFYCQEAIQGDPKLCPPHTYCPEGTLVPSPCPDGTFTPPDMVGLREKKECLACSPGHYCRGGRLEGKCAAGYFCQAGSSVSAPQGHEFPLSSLTECPWGQLPAGLCPAGFYCQEGSEVPTPCPPNTVRAIPGARQREDCLPCPPGRWCKAGDPVTYPCPPGHYCGGTNGTNPITLLAPQQCPEHTYRTGSGAQSLADCQPCPSGYLCQTPGLTSFEDYPCPPGYWCPGKGDRFFCPPGTFRTQPGAASLEDCDPCSPGFYCPDPAETKLPNVQGSPCQPGYECPPGSVNPIICRLGFYCGLHTEVPSLCPGGYYCPGGASTYNTPEQLCVFPYYCPPGSAHPLLCKGGYTALNVTGPRDSFERCCRICDPGSYRSDSLISPSCQPCPSGFSCPQGSASYLQQPCPRGYYCPPLASAPVPCPPGTYGNSSLAKQPEECHACPAGSFNQLYGQTGCFPCGSSSSSQPGASSCNCHGLNRAFQESDGSCICQAGYVYYDERGKQNSDTNSDQDCQPQVEERCAPGEVRLASTRKCISPDLYDCSPFCGALGGELSAELSMCHCEQYVSAEELCDRECLLNAPQISLSLGIDSVLLLSIEEGEDREVTNVLGPDEHVQKSQRVHFVLFGPTGVFGFIISSTNVLDAFLKGEFWFDLPLQRGRRGEQTASSKDTRPLPCIPNPMVCLNVGDAILFQLTIHPDNRTSSHYPVYQKQHLYNSNPGWDFGPFRRLDHLIQETHLNISRFAHVFLDPGRYVFRDSAVQEHILIVAVNEENMGCAPINASFQPSSPYQLARHRVQKHRALNLAPDWAAIAAVLFVLGFLMAVLMTLAIILRPPVSSPSPMNSWKPRWRSLGEPHIPPECILIKESLQFYEALGPQGSGEGAGGGERGVIHGPGEQPAVRHLEDFSVRTLYDKLEDQNLHLASQMAKHRMDVLAFYRGISQRIQSLMDMVQPLNSEGLKGLTRQSISVDRTQSSTQAAMGFGQNDESTSRDFQTMGHADAEWREAMELMKALKILLGKVHYGQATVKRDPAQHVPGQDGTAESSLASQRKAGVEREQDPGMLQQHGCSSRKGTFVACEEQGLGLQPGRAMQACLTELEVESLMATSPLARTLCEIRQALEKQQPYPITSASEPHLSASSPGPTKNTLVTTDLASLSSRHFVVYRFGCTVVRLLSRACSHPAVVLMLAQTVPDQSPERVQEVLQSTGDFYYDATNRFLYICSARLENAGEFIAILINAMAWIKAGSTAVATAHSCFQMELNKGITALANAFFQCSWGAVEKDPAEDKSSTCFDSQTIFEELLSIRMSPDTQFLEKSQHERLQHYRCFQLQLETRDMMESSLIKEAVKWSGDGDKSNAGSSGVQVANLEEMLDGLNEEFFQLTMQVLTSQKEEELLDQKLRIQEESFVMLGMIHEEKAQHFTEQLESWAAKRDQAQLLEIKRSCVAQRIKDTETELFNLLQTTMAISSAPEVVQQSLYTSYKHPSDGVPSLLG